MSLKRREVLQATGRALAASMLAANRQAIAQTAVSDDFSIDKTFVEFVRDIGGTPQDGGGSVTFTGREPIPRSHFRIGTSMTRPEMAAVVGAAAIWKERTGQARDVRVVLRLANAGTARNTCTHARGCACKVL
jgi:hypothetical protein